MTDRWGQEEIREHYWRLRTTAQQKEILRKDLDRVQRQRESNTGFFAHTASWFALGIAAAGGLWVSGKFPEYDIKTSGTPAATDPAWIEKVRPEGAVPFTAKTVIEETVVADTHVEQIKINAESPLKVEELTP